MTRHTVNGLARLSGVSVRTLHHYDELGLLKPAEVGDNGYRYYGRAELLRLQQILFHRELGLSLAEIAAVLDRPGFDRLAALRGHRDRLAAEDERRRLLLQTLDRTIADLEGSTPMKDADLYKGFPPEKQARYEAEIVDRFGEAAKPVVDHSRARWNAMSKTDFQGQMDELKAIETGLADLQAAGRSPDHADVAPLLRRHHAWVAKSWPAPPTADAYAGLADMYLGHPDFHARYETLHPGFAQWLADAMHAFAVNELA
ncbi:MerR family transcriptional regulator [Caulobacter sp. 17J65-9]|uniref:MerR family transcriptional regulator n=1 Tax=Caulobacter sp. 17J65-9 TaxID=2709382 RepID=UPI0013CCD9D9|nr:MerR family transcriptional regulator [Caulobacter sp. 17J65-9]NEX91868.1 MerR family transcriptional regulator [Caulobacter sp. 17J65-9]